MQMSKLFFILLVSVCTLALPIPQTRIIIGTQAKDLLTTFKGLQTTKLQPAQLKFTQFSSLPQDSKFISYAIQKPQFGVRPFTESAQSGAGEVANTPLSFNEILANARKAETVTEVPNTIAASSQDNLLKPERIASLLDDAPRHSNSALGGVGGQAGDVNALERLASVPQFVDSPLAFKNLAIKPSEPILKSASDSIATSSEGATTIESKLSGQEVTATRLDRSLSVSSSDMSELTIDALPIASKNERIVTKEAKGGLQEEPFDFIPSPSNPPPRTAKNQRQGMGSVPDKSPVNEAADTLVLDSTKIYPQTDIIPQVSNLKPLQRTKDQGTAINPGNIEDSVRYSRVYKQKELVEESNPLAHDHGFRSLHTGEWSENRFIKQDNNGGFCKACIAGAPGRCC